MTFLEDFARTRLMAIVRGPDHRNLVATAVALAEEGVKFIEIPLTSPDALWAIEQIRAATGIDTQIGAGTVLTPADVSDVTSAGAQFIVTPAVTDAVDAAVSRGLPVAAGAFTATEAYAARARGADLVKLFPASAVGPGYLRALHDPFPDLPFIAVGGVGPRDVVDYLAAGAIGVGVGSPLVGDAAQGGDMTALRERARAFTQAASRGSA